MSDGEGRGCCQPKPHLEHHKIVFIPGMRVVGHLSAMRLELQDGQDANVNFELLEPSWIMLIFDEDYK